jgi:hypothetical protein
MNRMNRLQLLAAEIFSYSYANYADHFGNPRFDTLMPRSAATLERAVKEQWPIQQVAKKLEVTAEEAQQFIEAYHRAIQVIDAENPAEAFRNGVRHSIQFALEDGLGDEEAVEHLVRQICYRTADLAYLLNLEGSKLSRYSRHLRRDPDVEYHEGYFGRSDK